MIENDWKKLIYHFKDGNTVYIDDNFEWVYVKYDIYDENLEKIETGFNFEWDIFHIPKAPKVLKKKEIIEIKIFDNLDQIVVSKEKNGKEKKYIFKCIWKAERKYFKEFLKNILIACLIIGFITILYFK